MQRKSQYFESMWLYSRSPSITQHMQRNRYCGWQKRFIKKTINVWQKSHCYSNHHFVYGPLSKSIWRLKHYFLDNSSYGVSWICCIFSWFDGVCRNFDHIRGSAFCCCSVSLRWLDKRKAVFENKRWSK